MSRPDEVRILYRNWKGETAVRRIVPMGVRLAATEWHPESQWLLEAFDVDKQAMRSFAMRDILQFDVPAEEPVSDALTWTDNHFVARDALTEYLGQFEDPPTRS